MNKAPLQWYPLIIFITGVSGVGKTSFLQALNQELPISSTACLYFDSIGVPSQTEMNKLYGSSNRWQKAMTYQWIKRILDEYKDKELVVIEGQVNINFIVSAFEDSHYKYYQILLIHCDEESHHQRLTKYCDQPELINEQMDNWAEFFEKAGGRKTNPNLGFFRVKHRGNGKMV